MKTSKGVSGSASAVTQVEPSQTESNAANTVRPKKAVKKNKTASSNPITEDTTTPVRGRPKSGRIWKTSKERFATVKKTIRGKKTKERLAYRDEIKQIKELSQSIKAERRRENEEKRLRREENKQKRLENERKSEIVQIIKNPAKLKRMRKKQLRMIEKRDISKLKVV